MNSVDIVVAQNDCQSSEFATWLTKHCGQTVKKSSAQMNVRAGNIKKFLKTLIW